VAGLMSLAIQKRKSKVLEENKIPLKTVPGVA